MTPKSPKSQIVAFKVEEELAEFLNRLPNRSAFIRRAIMAQIGADCPLCAGQGLIPRGVYEHFAPVLARNSTRKCDGCGERLALPRDAEHLDGTDRVRVEQFLNGGPLFCQTCYTKMPQCDDCGIHVAPDQFSEHYRRTHHK